MLRRTRVVVGLGEGHRARKTIDLALKHPKTDFISVDLLTGKEHLKYLRKKGLNAKPENLTFKRATDAATFLGSQKPNSLDHLYAHFFLDTVEYSNRQNLFSQLMRTLRPGGSFVAVEVASYQRQLPLELRSHGFRVSKRRISAEELQRLKTDFAEQFATAAGEGTNLINALLELAPDKDSVLLRIEKSRHLVVQEARKHVEFLLREQEGGLLSPDAERAAKVILADIPQLFSDRPFVVITAKKSRPIHL